MFSSKLHEIKLKNSKQTNTKLSSNPLLSPFSKNPNIEQPSKFKAHFLASDVREYTKTKENKNTVLKEITIRNEKNIPTPTSRVSVRSNKINYFLI